MRAANIRMIHDIYSNNNNYRIVGYGLTRVQCEKSINKNSLTDTIEYSNNNFMWCLSSFVSA